MGNPIISLQNIKKTFMLGEKTVNVLKGINLEVQKDDFLSIMGVSGSGKSTLLYIIGLMDIPTSGKYLLNGEEVENLSPESLSERRNAYIGFVFQQFYLIEYLNALENVLLPLLYTSKDIVSPRQKAKKLLDKVGLKGVYDNKPSELSGGEQQRVAIARALINDPEIILADEPTGQLDSNTSLGIMNLFSELNNEGHAVIMVTHDAEMASRTKTVVNIKDGKI